MLTVAPSGTTNFATVSLTTPVDITLEILTGIVAAELEHANAMSCAGAMCFKYLKGFFLVKKKYPQQYVMK